MYATYSGRKRNGDPEIILHRVARVEVLTSHGFVAALELHEVCGRSCTDDLWFVEPPHTEKCSSCFPEGSG